MKAKEIREMQVEQLRAKISDTREELMKLRFQQVTGQLTDSSRLRILRRDIARMETILNQSLLSAAAKEKE
jgi:large subunit ribosomal protein L29